ncbi:MAG: choice-of-anchor X domain-containing protein, partial [Candidatus Promineifilaceae bacterium]
PSGEGTFSLFSMAASAISASGLSPHSLSTGLGAGIVTNMGGPLGGKQLSARFVQPNGQPFGVPFTLYDDGDHGDGRAADGIFGSGPYTPPGPGSAYLHLQGTHLGAPFERVDPVPFTFQPLLLESLGSAANSGGTSTLQFRLTNLDTAGHDYSLSPTLPTGWTAGISQTVSLNPGQTVVLDADITMGPQGQNLPSGASGEVFLSAIEQEQGVMTASASATVSRRRPPVQISIFNDIPYLRPGGEKAVLDFFVTDAQGTAVADGTQVNLSATKGTIIPATAVTRGGAFAAEFTSGAAAGTAVITASVPDIALNAAVTAQTKIPIGSAPPNGIVLTAQHAVLVPGGQTLLTARVTNRYGEPVAGQMVRIGVSGDGQNGTVGSAQEVVSGSTNANGVFSATFTAGTRPGSAQIRAELLTSDGAEPRVVHDAHLAIDVSGGLHLPVIMKP